MPILKVENLSKKYPSFLLDNVSFSIPKGYIMGFIGENGSGKTTTLLAILNIINKDGGVVEIFDKDIDVHELEIKKDIAFMSGEMFYPKSKVKSITNAFKKFYTDFDMNKYNKYLKEFNIDENKKLDQLSKGMSIKYQIALALSHNARLIILDEPTSGLDPVARDNLLEEFQKIIEDGDVSILFSTHITSDLEKCADYITFIKNGRIIESLSKDELLDKYYLVNGNKEDLQKVKQELISFKENAFGFTGLTNKENLYNVKHLKTAKPNLEDIMIYYAGNGELKWKI